MSQARLLLLLCIGALVQASVSNKIPCPPNVKALSPFNASWLEGVWYEQMKFFPTPGNEGRCLGAKYTLQSDGSIEVTVAKLDPTTNKPAPITGKVTFSGPKTVGNVISAFPKRAPKAYVILKVDSTKYLVVFSCTNGASDVWIKTRSKNPGNLDDAYAALAPYPTLTKTAFVPTDQKNCPPMVWQV